MSALQGYGQKHCYDVVLFGKPIGETIVVKVDDGKGNYSYKMKSHSRVNVFFQDRSSSMDFDIKYLGGKLYSALCKAVNNSTQVITTITKDATGYIVKTDEEVKKITDAITFSSMELYYTEPTNQKIVFSERMGEFAEFVKTAPGEYMNKIKDVTNIYRYREGRLYEVEMRKPLGSAYLKVRD